MDIVVANGFAMERCTFFSREYHCCVLHNTRCKCEDYNPRNSKPTTNADKLRAMTDEELAELLTAVAQKSANKLCESLKTVEVDLSNCNFHILYEAHLDWLKQEVSDEENHMR
jgi:hypothetical protein